MAESDNNGKLKSCRVILASAVAKSLMSEVAADLSRAKRSPILVGFLANDDAAARTYADWTRRTCQEQ